jgi:septin family protein
MDPTDQRTLLDDDDRRTGLNGSTSYPSANGYAPEASSASGTLPGYTLMVAGRRTGKTSFLRLLLDTCEISPTASKEQLASVAKFVQGCSGHTSYIRTASIDIEVDIDGKGQQQRLALSLVDTPSIDFQDETSSERLVSEMLRHIDSRFAEGVEDVSARPRLLL